MQRRGSSDSPISTALEIPLTTMLTVHSPVLKVLWKSLVICTALFNSSATVMFCHLWVSSLSITLIIIWQVLALMQQQVLPTAELKLMIGGAALWWSLPVGAPHTWSWRQVQGFGIGRKCSWSVSPWSTLQWMMGYVPPLFPKYKT